MSSEQMKTFIQHRLHSNDLSSVICTLCLNLCAPWLPRDIQNKGSE